MVDIHAAGGTADVAKATGIVSGRPVVECPNPADAASPVYLHRGDYRTQIGQSADWRHHVETAAAERGAELVEGYYRDGEGWVCTTTTADDGRVAEMVRGWDRAAESRRAAERKAAQDAEDAQRDWQRVTGDRVRAALAAAGADLTGGLRWSAKLLAAAEITPESATAVRRLIDGASAYYDAMAYADRSCYRVRIATFGSSDKAVRIYPVALATA